ALHLLDQPGGGGRLAGAGRTKQHDVLLARLDALGQLGDRGRLVAAGLEVGDHAERGNRPLEVCCRTHESTVDNATDSGHEDEVRMTSAVPRPTTAVRLAVPAHRA